MKLFRQGLVAEIGVSVEEKLDAVAGLDIFEFLHFKFDEVLQALLFLLLNDGGDLGVVDEGGEPELWDALDDVIALVVERPPEFVVLLLNF